MTYQTDNHEGAGVGYPQPPQQPQQLINGSNSEDRILALFVHLMFFVVGGIGPLIVFLVKKDESKFVRHHAAEALNFILTGLIILAGSSLIAVLLLFLGSFSDFFGVAAAAFFIIGYVAFLGIMVLGMVFSVMAAIAANKGDWYRYPLTLRLIK